MNNINVRVVGTANTTQMSASFAKVQAQVAALNTQLAQMVQLNNGVDARGYQQVAAAAKDNSRIFRDSLASSGMFEVQQLRVNKATDDYIEKLKAQKMSFRELRRDRDTAAKAFRSQLAMENMQIRKNIGATANGKHVLDVAVPTELSKDVGKLNQRLAFFNHQLKSGAHQLVNWGKNTQWAGRQLMVGLTMPVAAFGAAAGVMAYQIDKELTRIQKVYDTTADSSSSLASDVAAVETELAQLREQGMRTATKAAKEYGSAAEDTLSVQAELAAVGMKGAELQESTNQVMRIATLGELEHGVATKALIALQSTLNATVQETTQSFDFMNSVENATSLATADFAAAIPRALGPMKEMSKEGASAQEVLENLTVLMVAMKERGIEAGEGANAVKALMARVYRPSKQVRSEWQAMGLGDPATFAEQGEDIMDILGMVAEKVENLKGNERTRALAGLFGTYQVARMNAMLKGLNNVQNEGSQVSRVFQVMNEDASEWANTSEREMKRQAESIAGRWDRAFQAMKLQISEFGEPFVQVATVVVKGITKIMQAFIAMPDIAKWGVGILTVFAALAGPVVMLVGLFANLAGQGLSLVGSLIGLAAKMNLVTTNGKAMELSSRLAESGFVTQRTAVQQLTAELNTFSAAQAEANALMNQGTRAAAGPGKHRAPGPAVTTPAMPTIVSHGGFTVDKKRFEMEAKSARVAKQKALAVQNVSKFSSMAAASTAAMATGMLLTMTNSDGVANSIGQWLVISSVIMPAVASIAPLMKLIKARAIATAAGMGAAATATGGFAMKARAAAIAVHGMLGPIGWITLALAGIGTALYAGYKNSEKKAAEHLKTQKMLNRNAADYADHVGAARREWEKMHVVGMPKAEYSEFEDAQRYYREGKEGEKYADHFRDLRNDSDEEQLMAEERYIELMTKYKMTAKEATHAVAALYNVGGGRPAYEAYDLAEKIANQYGNISNFNWKRAMSNASQQASAAFDFSEHSFYKDADEFEKLAKTEGKKIAEIAYMAISSAGSPAEAKDAFSFLEDAAMEGWRGLFDRYTDESHNFSAEFRKLMQEQGILNAKELANWYDSLSGDELDEFHMKLPAAMRGVIQNEMQNANALETNVIQTLARDYLDLGTGVRTVIDAQNEFNIQAKQFTYEEARKEVKGMMEDISGFDDLVGNMMNPLRGSHGEFMADSKEQIKEILATATPEEIRQLKGMMEAFAIANDIELSDDPLVQYFNILDRIGTKTRGVADDTKNAEDAAWSWAKALKSADFAKFHRAGMENVQQEIAEVYREDLSDQHESEMETRQRYWDNRQEALSASFDQRSRALDAKWERRKDGAEAYWDRRIKNVEKAMEAEKKAEDLRQKMFDNEIARINRLNDMANRNIDFNVALSTGEFDEAAKIRNDADAERSQTVLEKAAERGSRRTERRLDRLESRRDSVEKARERHMKALEKREEAERRHLDKMRDMQEKNLERKSEADIKALEEQQEREKDSLEDRLDMFLSFTARNQKELKEHMKNVGLSYDKFGGALMKKGKKWSKFFRENLAEGIRKAANDMRTDKVWERLGKKSRNEVLKGMGFKNWRQFQNFVETGTMPDGGGGGNNGGGRRRRRGKGKNGGKNIGRGAGGAQGVGRLETRHDGGEIGSGLGSRRGVAKNQKGLHPSETLVRAQKGEFMVNRKDAARNADILHKINSGEDIGDTGQRHGTPRYGRGGPGGMAGITAGVMANMFAKGLAQGIMNVKESAEASHAAAAALYGAGKGGMYGDRSFSPEQMKNAAIIANVGSSMGMSNRDIMIGIMTAIAESGLINVNYGDRDSLGLFQQRPSMGWGTPEQVTNPEYAARAFFRPLKGHTERTNESPWLAAQHIQRSAFADGSNYRDQWDSAQDIFKKGLSKTKMGNYNPISYAAGRGGWHRPTPYGSWSNTHDIGVPVGTPVYAVGNGRVIESRYITSGGSSGNGSIAPNGKPYRSYGEMIKLQTSGGVVNYGHLQAGSRVRAGTVVKGGAQIARSGNTGNSSGAHLHLDIGGAQIARSWLASRGISLSKGAANVKWDNTIANLHKGEAVLTEDLNKKFHQGVENFATGGNSTYNVNVHVNGTNASADEIAQKVMTNMKRLESRKPQSRRA